MEGIEAIAGEMGATATIGGQRRRPHRLRPVRRRARRRTSAKDEHRRPWTRSCSAPSWPTTLGAEVGDRLPLTSDVLEGEPDQVTVTGIGAVAGMGFELDPGTSALVTPEVAELYPDGGVSVLLIRFADDADREARLAELRERFPLTVLAAPVPSRSVQTLDGLRALPVALAVAVALLALAAGANAALASRAATPARAGGRQGPRAAASGGPAGRDVAGRGLGRRRAAGRPAAGPAPRVGGLAGRPRSRSASTAPSPCRAG